MFERPDIRRLVETILSAKRNRLPGFRDAVSVIDSLTLQVCQVCIIIIICMVYRNLAHETKFKPSLDRKQINVKSYYMMVFRLMQPLFI